MMRFTISIAFALMICTAFAEEPKPPFAPPNSEKAARLEKILKAWEAQCRATKTLECNFQRWHFDGLAAPPGVHSEKESGRIAYASPDKGLYRVDEKLFFQGMKQGKPGFTPRIGGSTDYWILNGTELSDLDGTNQKITIFEFGSVEESVRLAKRFLPLVFQVNATEIQNDFWVREIKPPKQGIYLLEAWPKTDDAKRYYKLLQIALNEKTLQPEALIMYAPNFNAKNAPVWYHYEFDNVKRNTLTQKLPMFEQSFSFQPPDSWTVTREPGH